MNAIVSWLESVFGSIPLPVMEVWGRFAYVIGFALAIAAFGGFTFRLGNAWGFGRERQAWDSKAVLAISVTFVLILATGYLGSSVVLVPGAQTLETLKDLVVFVCILVFGYPALITVPFAYALSDLVEGVPPGFLLDWLPGYFINPACFWIAYQLFGKNPDFRLGTTWKKYLVFVLLFMSIEPVLWGFICAGEYTPQVSYRVITPALFFTISITWLLAPPTMLVALPFARHLDLFWAEIRGHVKERALASKDWIWEAGAGRASDQDGPAGEGIPIRMFLLTPLITFVLLMVGVTASVTLNSAQSDATKLALRLHQEMSDNIRMRLDGHMLTAGDSLRAEEIDSMLARLPVATVGRAIVVDSSGRLIASSAAKSDPVVESALAELRRSNSNSAARATAEFHFDHIVARPPSREGWFGRVGNHQGPSRSPVNLAVITLLPEQYYLAGVREGNSRAAMVFSAALLLSLAVAATLSTLVVEPIRKLSRATSHLAHGSLPDPMPGSRLTEIDTLARSLNEMTERLRKSIDELRRHRDNLEELVGERTVELAESYKRLQSLEQMRDNLVHMVFHDMRSPLTVLLANLNLLRVGPAGKVSDEVAEDIKFAIQSAEAVNRMANDLLDVSRLEEGKMPVLPRSTDIVAIARNAATSLAAWDPSRKIAVEREAELLVRCDPTIVRRIMENLLSNAIKHTPSGGDVRISVEERGGFVEVAVHDRGPGVPVEARERIFEKFGAMEARQEKTYHSAGLGLAFCKLAIEAHQGRVGVDSRTGEGSSFWFELPK